MFLLNSHLGSFAAALQKQGRPYLEITAAVLPSSLTRVLSIALVFSTYLPVSVCGTDTITLALEVFLDGSATRVDSTKGFVFRRPLETVDPDLPRSFLEATNVHTIDTLEL